MADVITADPSGHLKLADLLRFPCALPKRPLTSQGFKSACRMPWAGWPLVGVPTGEPNGFDVLDIDPDHGGWEWLTDNHTRLPATQIHMTRSGGAHYLFRHAEGVRNRSGMFPGVDVRGDGGYVIWWPQVGLNWSANPVADWPEWLLEEVRRGRRRARAAAPETETVSDTVLKVEPTRDWYGREKRLLQVVERALPGNRNNALFWSASRFVDMVHERYGPLPIWRRHRRAQLRRAGKLLVEACRLNGLLADDGPEEVSRTINNAFRRIEP
jgi:hypothetical protein